MSETNGTGTRVLSLDEKRNSMPRKGNDYITVQQCYDLIIQECAKVHEYYLTQMPPYVANMIADALVDRGLIPEFRTGPVAVDSVESDRCADPANRKDNSGAPQGEDAASSINTAAESVPVDSEGPEAA